MISAYLNQTAVWHSVTGRDKYGAPTTTSKTIAVRWEEKRRLVRDAQGHEVVSEATVYCTETVLVGDLLEYSGRRWPAIAVSVIAGLNGEEHHREVAV